MFGYTLDNAIQIENAIASALTTVEYNNDPFMFDGLYMAKEIVQGLIESGYFK